MLDKGNVEVLTTEVSVSVGGLDLEYTALELEDRDVESSAAQVMHGYNILSRLVHTICEGSSGGLVDDEERIEPGIHGCLPLSVVEVIQDDDDGLGRNRGREFLMRLDAGGEPWGKREKKRLLTFGGGKEVSRWRT